MIVTTTNMDYLIPAVRLYVGDVTELSFSDALIRTSLVSSVKYLASKWNNRYFIYSSGMLNGEPNAVNTPNGVCTLDPLPNEYDIFRNCLVAFTSNPPPVIEQQDEPPIILAAAILLRRSVIASSVSVFHNWSTPDLTYSNVSSAKALLDMIAADQKMLDEYFHRRLGVARKSTFPLAMPENLLPLIRYPEQEVTYTKEP